MKTVYIIGRDPHADIVIDDGQETVSRRHAELRRGKGAWYLADLQSANGTYVYDPEAGWVAANGRNIDPQDRILLGSHEVSGRFLLQQGPLPNTGERDQPEVGQRRSSQRSVAEDRAMEEVADQDGWTIGRHPSADIPIGADDNTVSGSHAVLLPPSSGREEWVLVDCGSTNGTYVWRAGRWDAVKRARVKAGDRLSFGAYEARFEDLVNKARKVERDLSRSQGAPTPEEKADRDPDPHPPPESKGKASRPVASSTQGYRKWAARGIEGLGALGYLAVAGVAVLFRVTGALIGYGVFLLVVGSIAVVTVPNKSVHMERMDEVMPRLLERGVEEEVGLRPPERLAAGGWRVLRPTVEFKYEDWVVASVLYIEDDDGEWEWVSFGVFGMIINRGEVGLMIIERAEDLE
ncbi:FHA domain-containing protein [Halorhodospira sp. 9622]|uniref:FHA domain-containing protein n=1 Tax=Halorhodospira sp. 9622 TaxID=2899136 RepID=UPI001EE7C3B1|nr:FHA domain-containing protein [Halorhodospira sp. 9622]MCG5539345.1 FHA domain-containing protein [Halorhodospira sp. 9622]